MKRTLLSFFFLGGLLSATPVNVQLVNAGNPGVVAYGAYVGPYTLGINGLNAPGMCMDDFIESNVGDTWTANRTDVSSGSFSNTYLGDAGSSIGGQHYSSSQVYTAEAYLFSLITQNRANRADIQEAAWALMDANTYQTVFHSTNNSVENYIHYALDNSSSFDASAFSIISKTGTHSEQEFMVAGVSSAPEPGTIALLGSGFLAVGAFRLRRKKRGS